MYGYDTRVTNVHFLQKRDIVQTLHISLHTAPALPIFTSHVKLKSLVEHSNNLLIKKCNLLYNSSDGAKTGSIG